MSTFDAVIARERAIRHAERQRIAWQLYDHLKAQRAALADPKPSFCIAGYLRGLDEAWAIVSGEKP